MRKIIKSFAEGSKMQKQKIKEFCQQIKIIFLAAAWQPRLFYDWEVEYFYVNMYNIEVGEWRGVGGYEDAWKSCTFWTSEGCLTKAETAPEEKNVSTDLSIRDFV